MTKEQNTQALMSFKIIQTLLNQHLAKGYEDKKEDGLISFFIEFLLIYEKSTHISDSLWILIFSDSSRMEIRIEADIKNYKEYLILDAKLFEKIKIDLSIFKNDTIEKLIIEKLL